MSNSLTVNQLKEYLAAHRSEHPNLGERSLSEIWNELPDQDTRLDGSEEGIRDLLNDLDYPQS